jgi:hypothetical protein
MLPAMYAEMEARGWPTCPYVNPVKDSPDHGIAEFLETARFSTGYAALHHTIGFMPETHMLKPFADRYTRCARWSRRRSISRSQAWRPDRRSCAAPRKQGRTRARVADPLGDGRSESVDLPLQGL